MLHRSIFCLVLTLLFSVTAVFAQKDREAEKAIKTTINRFFEGLEKGDTAMIRSTCTAAPILQTYMADKSGVLHIETENFDDFVNFISTPTKNKYKEQIKFEAIHTEKSLASVWAPYVFFLNGKVSHSGTDSFQLVKTPEGWKIQYILDTRRK